MYSFYFSEPGGLSWADIGEPDLSNIRSDGELVQIQLLEKDMYFADYCQGVAFGATEPSHIYSWQPNDRTEDAGLERD